jgi:short subunit dehydrogenase-like uncharacterized protein
MMAIERQAVAVFGAGGHTGQFVVAELERRGIAPIAVGRDASKLSRLGFADRGIPVREASIADPFSLDRAFADAAAVINCAGPFLDTAEPVISSALRSGVHYLDVTAEQPSARIAFEKFGMAAKAAGLVILPAMGFYGGLADLLVVAAMDDWAETDRIDVAIALDRWHPTRGTRITGARNIAPRMTIANGRLTPLAQRATGIERRFPAPFGRQEMVELPFSETVLIANHVRTRELHSYLNRTALRDIRDPSTPPPEPADAAGRSAQHFLVDVSVRKGGDSRQAIARGRDIYAVSAPLIVEAAQRILDGKVFGRGARAPGALFDARDFLRALAPEHLEFTYGRV